MGRRNSPAASVLGASVIALLGLAGASSAQTGPTGYAAAVVADQPAAYWRLGEATGSFADSSPSGTHAASQTVFHPSDASLFLRAQPGAVATDDGAIHDDAAPSGLGHEPNGAYVHSPSATPLGHRNPFSLEIWAKPLPHDAQDTFGKQFSGGMIGNFDMDGSGSFNYGAGVYLSWPTRQPIFVRAGQGTGRDVLEGPPLSTSTWSHVVATYDGETMRTYVDGALVQSVASTRDIGLTPATTRIGAFRMDFGVTDYAGYFYGSLDEAAVYGRALTAEEIAGHFQAATESPGLELTPSTLSAVAGATHSFTARVLGTSASSGLPVTFRVEGANPQELVVATDTNGEATMPYTPYILGIDTITASASIAGTTHTAQARAPVSGVTCSGRPGQPGEYPGATTSFYYDGQAGPVRATMADAYARGRRLGDAVVERPRCPDRVEVVLHFGLQEVDAQGRFYNVTSDFGYRRSLSFIRQTAKAWALGFYVRTEQRPGVFLRLVIGTNNDNDFFGSRPLRNCPDARPIGYCAGKAWADMIERTNDELRQLGSGLYPLANKTRVVGGNDIEADFCRREVGCSDAARDWVRGYRAGTSRLLINFGSCDGCPLSGPLDGSERIGRASNNGRWTTGDVYFVSWGAGRTRPLPQIYNGAGNSATQWGLIARYARTAGTPKPVFEGSLTTELACLQREEEGVRRPCGPRTPLDRWLGQGPQAGWDQLYRELNVNTPTWLMQPLVFATDIAKR